MTFQEFRIAVGEAISAVTKPIGNFLNKHWVSVAVVILGLLVFAAAIALLVFAWPGFIAAAAAATITLPLSIGTIAPLAFLSSLSIPAAAAVLSTFAFVGFVAASGLVIGTIKLLNKAYEAVDKWFTRDLPDPERDQLIDRVENGVREVARDSYDAGVIAGTSSYHKEEMKSFIRANKPVIAEVYKDNNSRHYPSPLLGRDPNPFKTRVIEPEVRENPSTFMG
ncbi:MAG: hypothetical protein H0T84_09250 [Tatlockia sp.]|nr:hypothetical protein [Tatlockia sp.]